MADISVEAVGAGLVSVFVLVGGAYKAFLSLRKDTSTNGHAIAIDSANEQLIKTLQEERDSHKADLEEVRKQNSILLEQNILLKSTQSMLRLLLIQKGVTLDELKAIGALA